MSPKSIRVLIHLCSALMGICSAVLAYSDKFSVVQGISPQVAKYWPLTMIVAGILEKAAKAILDAMQPTVITAQVK